MWPQTNQIDWLNRDNSPCVLADMVRTSDGCLRSIWGPQRRLWKYPLWLSIHCQIDRISALHASQAGVRLSHLASLISLSRAPACCLGILQGQPEGMVLQTKVLAEKVWGHVHPDNKPNMEKHTPDSSSMETERGSPDSLDQQVRYNTCADFWPLHACM